MNKNNYKSCFRNSACFLIACLTFYSSTAHAFWGSVRTSQDDPRINPYYVLDKKDSIKKEITRNPFDTFVLPHQVTVSPPDPATGKIIKTITIPLDDVQLQNTSDPNTTITLPFANEVTDSIFRRYKTFGTSNKSKKSTVDASQKKAIVDASLTITGVKESSGRITWTAAIQGSIRGDSLFNVQTANQFYREGVCLPPDVVLPLPYPRCKIGLPISASVPLQYSVGIAIENPNAYGYRPIMLGYFPYNTATIATQWHNSSISFGGGFTGGSSNLGGFNGEYSQSQSAVTNIPDVTLEVFTESQSQRNSDTSQIDWKTNFNSLTSKNNKEIKEVKMYGRNLFLLNDFPKTIVDVVPSFLRSAPLNQVMSFQIQNPEQTSSFFVTVRLRAVQWTMGYGSDITSNDQLQNYESVTTIQVPNYF